MGDRASSPASAPVPTPQQKSETADTEIQVKKESSNPPSPTVNVPQNAEPPSASPSRTIRRTVAQRRAFLLDDPLSGDVEPYRVYCRGCQRWIRLAMNSEYALANWQSHRRRCSASPTSRRSIVSKPRFSPGSKVATAERKVVLLNDPQVKHVSQGHVQCGNCRAVVTLEGEVDYDLTKWAEHKEKCIPMTPTPITPHNSRSRVFPPLSTSSTYSQVSVGRSARSPTPGGEGSSSNSTETTAATPESSPATVNVGVKRSRDEETEDEEEVADDERPTNRPRTETYKSPEKDGPSLFGWFMHPLKEFARGFREGLSST